MKIDYEITKEVYQKLVTDEINYTKRIIKFFYLFLILVVLSGLALLIYTLTAYQLELKNMIYAIVILLSAAINFIMTIFLQKTVNKLKDDELKTDNFLCHIEMHEDYFIYDIEDERFIYKYHELKKIVIDKSFITFICVNNNRCLIEKKAMSNINDLLDAVKSHGKHVKIVEK